MEKLITKTRSFLVMFCSVGPLLAVLQISPVIQAKPLKIAFINPTTPEEIFWSSVTKFMESVAKDLDIQLEVYYSEHNRFEAKRIAERILNGPEKPDYLVFHIQAQVGLEILQAAEKAKVPSFIFNTDIPLMEQASIGEPREKFRYWLGHMFPDDVQAGYALAATLVDIAIKNKAEGSDGKIQVVGLSGTRDTSAAIDRNTGLKNFAERQPRVNLHQIAFSYWDTEKAFHTTSGFILRYPEISVVWSASDGMAFGAVQAIEKAGRKLGKDIFTGGVDWTHQAIEAVHKGEMAATVGGHFMEGGWVLVLLYDYHHGIDFATTGTTIRSSMQVIHAGNVQQYLDKLVAKDWDQIDYRKFSKKHNPHLLNYDFSLSAILAE